MTSPNINDVKRFWESNPLWTGESRYEPETKEFYEEQRDVVIEDNFAGRLDKRIFPSENSSGMILDLGCGPGLWTVELSRNGCKNIISVDLTLSALRLTKDRCRIYGIKAVCTQQNAEILAFRSRVFSHVNCQGVIHHTPSTQACIREIARVLKNNGTAVISVYYKNIFLRLWPFLRWLGKLLNKMGAAMPGRGREDIYTVDNINEIVRRYDGIDNPIGKCYLSQEFIRMLAPYFDVQEIYLHFFPARSLPFKIPRVLHRMIDRYAGFMMFATLKKR